MSCRAWEEIDSYHYEYNCKKTKNKYDLTIGKNKVDNWKILDDAHENDYWFHLENMPSAHVIVHIV